MLRGEVDLAALPGGAGEHPGDRGLQPGVGVGDHQPHAAEAPVSQRAQERGPEHLVFAVADIDAEHFTVAVDGDRGGDDDGAGDDAMVVAGLDVGGVQVHVGHRDVIERPGAEHGDFVVDARADPLTPSTSTPRTRSPAPGPDRRPSGSRCR